MVGVRGHRQGHPDAARYHNPAWSLQQASNRPFLVFSRGGPGAVDDAWPHPRRPHAAAYVFVCSVLRTLRCCGRSEIAIEMLPPSLSAERRLDAPSPHPQQPPNTPNPSPCLQRLAASFSFNRRPGESSRRCSSRVAAAESQQPGAANPGWVGVCCYITEFRRRSVPIRSRASLGKLPGVFHRRLSTMPVVCVGSKPQITAAGPGVFFGWISSSGSAPVLH